MKVKTKPTRYKLRLAPARHYRKLSFTQLVCGARFLNICEDMIFLNLGGCMHVRFETPVKLSATSDQASMAAAFLPRLAARACGPEASNYATLRAARVCCYTAFGVYSRQL